MTIIGAIPVKKESKRFPGKNFMKIGGDYLINLAIERLNLPIVDHIVVSTDAVERVKAIVSEAWLPDKAIEIVERSASVTDGDLQSSEPIGEAIAQGKYSTEDIVVMTQVTSPLIRSQTVARCLTIWENTPDLDLVVTVNPDNRPNGGVYICKVKHLIAPGSLYHGRVHVHRIPFDEGIDIDYPHQLAIADAIARGDAS